MDISRKNYLSNMELPSIGVKQVLPIKDLTRDARLQQRVDKDEQTVRDYASRMVGRNNKSRVVDPGGEAWPEAKAIDDGDRLWVYDGFQRLAAAEEAGLKTFQVEVEKGTWREAFVRSLKVNLRGKKGLTNADKNKIVNQYLMDEEFGGWANNYIAEEANVSHEMVRQVRDRLISDGLIKWRGRLKSRDGKMIKASSPPAVKRARAAKKERTVLDPPMKRGGAPLQPLQPNEENKEQPKSNIERKNFRDVDNQPNTPQDVPERPYNPIELGTPSTEQENVTKAITGDVGAYRMVNHMSKQDWTSLANRLRNEKIDTFIAPLPRNSKTIDPLRWVVKHTSSMDGRDYRQYVIIGNSVYFVWSLNDISIPHVYSTMDDLIADLELART